VVGVLFHLPACASNQKQNKKMGFAGLYLGMYAGFDLGAALKFRWAEFPGPFDSVSGCAEMKRFTKFGWNADSAYIYDNHSARVQR
jgi:hypothetical protein